MRLSLVAPDSRVDAPRSALVRSPVDDDPDAATVRVAGELDIATAPQLGMALAGALSHEHVVVLDLRDVIFIDIFGVHAVVDAGVRAREGGRRLEVLRGRAAVDRIFALAEHLGQPAVGFSEAGALRAQERVRLHLRR